MGSLTSLTLSNYYAIFLHLFNINFNLLLQKRKKIRIELKQLIEVTKIEEREYASDEQIEGKVETQHHLC